MKEKLIEHLIGKLPNVGSYINGNMESLKKTYGFDENTIKCIGSVIIVEYKHISKCN